MQIQMPAVIVDVSGSQKAKVPIRMAVIGSKTPSTAVFVAPILRVEMAIVRVEIIVGIIASPTIFPHPCHPSIPWSRFSPLKNANARNRSAPIERT